MIRRAPLLALVAGSIFFGGHAYAQRPANEVDAEKLFDRAKALMDTGKFVEACPMLEESQRLDPGGGTLLHLAVCYEGEGKVASAWSTFNAAIEAARLAHRKDRERFGRDHVEALSKRLTQIVISVPSELAHTPELEVTCDGKRVEALSWGLPFPVERGTHLVVVSAPGKKPFRNSAAAPAEGTTVTVVVPSLAADAPAIAKPAPPVSPALPAHEHEIPAEPSNNSRSTAGYFLIGGGVVGVVVGSVFGLRAIAKRSDSDNECPQGNCTSTGVSLNNEALTSAWVSNIAFAVGLVTAGVGTYFVLTAKSARPKTSARSPIKISPLVFRSGSGLGLVGDW